jgi:hypothetical protein
MADPVSVLGAAAAVLAAGFAGMNLLMSDRRDRTKWAREALVEVLVSFLDRSFYMGRTSRVLLGARLDSAAPDELARISTLFRQQDDEQRSALTRIRLLGNRRAVQAAEDLLRADRLYFESAHTATSMFMDEERETCRAAREAFVVAAKHTIALPLRSVPPIALTGVLLDIEHTNRDRSSPPAQ